jgi:hypothetical protein
MTMSSTTESATVLTGMYAAEAEYLAAGGPGEASFDLLAPFFAPDVELHQADALPYGGTWRGHNGMTQFFLMMGEVWESFEMVEQEFLATGETAVVLTQVCQSPGFVETLVMRPGLPDRCGLALPG